MPIEWVGESLSSTYTPSDTRPVDPLDKGPANRDQGTPNSAQGKRSFKNPYRQSLTRRPQRLEQAVFAKEIMQTRLQTVTQTDPISKIIDLIVHQGLDYLPVIDKVGKLSGLITYRDILHILSNSEPTSKRTVEEIMGPKVLTATGNTTLHELSRVMVMENVDCVPIVDNAQKLVGLITTGNMMQCIVNHSKLNVWI